MWRGTFMEGIIQQSLERKQVEENYHYTVILFHLDKIVHRCGECMSFVEGELQKLNDNLFITFQRMEDEILVLVENLGLREAEELAFSIKNRIENYISSRTEGFEPVVAGIVRGLDELESFEDVYDKARYTLDFAISENKIMIHPEKTKGNYLRKNKINLALKNYEFILEYQPIMNYRENQLAYCEALIRWQSPDYGRVFPVDFIQQSERLGLITSIGKWVFEESVKQISQWKEGAGFSCDISVNVSPFQLQYVNLAEEMGKICEDHGVSPSKLILEITESARIQNLDEYYIVLKKFRELGFRLSIDDFGRGYSSLSYLKSFSFDALKIDRYFSKNITENIQDIMILRAMIRMINSLGIRVVVEGVETFEQAEMLKNLGCNYMQGYYFSRAVHPDNILSIYGKNRNEGV